MHITSHYVLLYNCNFITYIFCLQMAGGGVEDTYYHPTMLESLPFDDMLPPGGLLPMKLELGADALPDCDTHSISSGVESVSTLCFQCREKVSKTP